MTDSNQNLRTVRSFIRRNKSKISKYQKRLLQEFLPEISLTDKYPKDLVGYIEDYRQKYNLKDIILEIGFGHGENILNQAVLFPNHLFLASDIFLKGIAKLNKSIYENKIQNILIYQDDGLKLLELLPDKMLSQILILFPDPWPKKKHHKRRIINYPNIELFARKLNTAGTIKIATDYQKYALWILRHFINSKQYFNWQVKTVNDWYAPFENHITTYYEQKAQKDGSRIFYYIFNKII